MTDDQSAFAVPPPDPELKRLEPLLGTWKSEDHTLDSIYGAGVSNNGPFYETGKRYSGRRFAFGGEANAFRHGRLDPIGPGISVSSGSSRSRHGSTAGGWPAGVDDPPADRRL